MGDRTPPRRRQNRLPTLRRGRRRRMRTPSPNSRDNEDSGIALQAPPNIQRRLQLDDAAEDNNNNHNNNNSHQNYHDDTVRPEDRPDHERVGGIRRQGSHVQPELKF